MALEQARTAYAQAQQTPEIVAHAPVHLQEADQALRRAERVWADDHDTGGINALPHPRRALPGPTLYAASRARASDVTDADHTFGSQAHLLLAIHVDDTTWSCACL
jgi:hypothetical protein